MVRRYGGFDGTMLQQGTNEVDFTEENNVIAESI